MTSDKMRIVFMGTPDFALASLKALVENHYNVVGVVTVADKPSGRGQKLHQSPVKLYAESKGIPVLQPIKLKDETFVNALKALQPDLQIVVAFRMLPEVVWRLPKYGTFNLHASLLPNYRGAAPINWAIINGEKETGVTTFFIDEKIDTGAIIAQEVTPIESHETAGTLHDKLMVQGAELVLKTVDSIAEGTCTTQPQNKEVTFAEAPKIYKETCKIDWQAEGMTIERLVRGMSPYPTAWTAFVQKGEVLNVKVYDAIFEPVSHQYSIGELLVGKKGLRVAVKDGYIQLLELQLPAKKRMKTNDLLNGFSFDNTTIL
ncbi:methionyl-tRNA formyltransferase [Capnocytophaga ochracea DSM 7271]|uniref:Methionyl-tRNA formyltransferase n=1 Tax=Capnocytophaga ochracea (strain ATCC 27872 / DSM 7271 / CCUG 9716 / JCM 12966 / NCTC 12371 / SS31 / VPI 2845) TaxID=521097 RepID=C7M6H0_CAPOD|nr:MULTISPECIES: methionyl-tRNA formyltransferase [Capnocytophaga]ACU93036.1 methionyl-tRNA formyltransferase [Capnocytophaga ochracea DSM 7271]EJF34946.1 methionyl-tRNA formyltransferase [Capnocytophaga sp. oral taxon 335 str. F0486]UAK51735.1 methionyl-tRNA formyltransferase [Capnocytophaga ochracea]